MSLDEAKTGVTLGLPFGSLYPMLDETDRDDFRQWFVRDRTVPNLRDRPHQSNGNKVLVAAGCGYTGNACPSCGSVRVVRSGACETCNECGTTSSCG